MMPTTEELQELWIEWFTANYGIKPVHTSSTGFPAVAFAEAMLKRFGAREAD